MAKFEKLAPGKILSESQFYTTVKVVGNKVQLANDHGENIVVDSGYVEKCLNSADQYDKTETLTRTELAAKFIASSAVALTVNFNKQVKEVDVVKEIQEAYESSTPKEFTTKLKKSVKTALEGVERTMVGRHYGHVNEFGRVSFIDMEEKKLEGKDYDSRIRQVDPRSLNYLIVRGIKYIVK